MATDGRCMDIVFHPDRQRPADRRDDQLRTALRLDRDERLARSQADVGSRPERAAVAALKRRSGQGTLVVAGLVVSTVSSSVAMALLVFLAKRRPMR